MTGALAQHDTAVPVRGSSTEDLIRAAHLILRNSGVQIGTQRVTRLVRQYKAEVERNGFSFLDFFVNAIQLDADQRRRVAVDPEISRVIGYADPTGEAAVALVMRARDSNQPGSVRQHRPGLV